MSGSPEAMNDLRVRSSHSTVDHYRRYDVNVLVLFHYSGIYRERVNWFKSLGLVNILGRRVHVTAVCSLGDGPAAEEIASGWPAGVDLTILEMQSNQPVPKLNGACLWLQGQHIQAKWLLRVDDDSVTDIDGLLTRQEVSFGGSAVHLMNTPSAIPLTDALTQDLSQHLAEEGILLSSLGNEYEASLTSEAAMRRIYGSDAACRFLRYAGEHFTDPGDKCLAFAARVADVPTATAHGMSHQFQRDGMSIVGGEYMHIHYVDWNDECFTEMLWAFLYGSRGRIPPDILRSMEGRALGFGRCFGYPLDDLTFAETGRLGGSGSANESFWKVVHDTVWLQDETGNPTTSFETLLTGRSGRWLVGPCLAENRMHYLGPL